ncbi:MAG: AbrB/MazE/SpoVT family DNA-binding domain-containing protein [Bacteroidales bacterium]|nr:AbrB/MazE/SpoVT family DNA-binding domain-containing protein [Bacteroidales bacterium]
MLSKVQKWGNSQGIIIPRKLLDDTFIEVGEDVDIFVQNGKIVVKSTKKIHCRYNIKDLIEKMPKDYKSKEENWGSPVGKEVW